jgi:PAS domain S-box-containing protein
MGKSRTAAALGGTSMSQYNARWKAGPATAVKYGIAVFSVTAALVFAVLMQTYLQTEPFASSFLCAIMFAAWFAGFGPDLLAAVLAVLAFIYYAAAPTHSFNVAPTEIPRVVAFAAAALFVLWMSAAQRAAANSLRRTHDSLQAAMHELERINRVLQRENAERERVERQLRRAEQDLQTIVDTIPAGVGTFRRDGFPEFFNRFWRSYTGLSLQELTADGNVTVHPDDLASAESEWRTHLATGEPFQREQRERRSDGEYRWHLIRRVPLRDDSGNIIKWYSAGYDIDDQRRAEDALRRSEAYLAEAQRLSHTGSFGKGVAGGDTVWSKEMFRIFEIDQPVKPTLDLMLERVHPDDRELVRREIYNVTRCNQDHDYEHRLMMPNGMVKHLHVRAHHVKYQSGEEELIGVLMDVTATREAQEALQKAQAELVHVTRLTTLGEMSASIAHEVNQPLAAIGTNGEACLRWLAREVPNKDEAVAAVRRIIHDANRASGVVHRIRELARKAESEMIQLDINELIDETVALVKRETLIHRVVLRLQLAPGLPPVLGDRVQLQQVIFNLVINALQAAAMVADRARVVTIRTLQYESDQVLVAVQDAGIGVEPENLNQLFTAFYTTKPDGMGIGLTICRSIVEAHGGRVWADRNTGPGMTFQFTISSRMENALSSPVFARRSAEPGRSLRG